MEVDKKLDLLLEKSAMESKVIEFFNNEKTIPYNYKQISAAIGADSPLTRALVVQIIEELALEGVLKETTPGKFKLADRNVVCTGTFVRRSNGKNGVVLDSGGGEVIFVAERNSKHALNGDKVKIHICAKRPNCEAEAEVLEILEAKEQVFIGTLKVEDYYGLLITDSKFLATDIFIPKELLKDGKTGDKAVVKIVDWPESANSPMGKVVDILGVAGDNNSEMHAILAEFGLPYVYPKEVEEAAEKIEPGITAEEIAKRRDMREAVTFTIDPHDAKDFDDALSIRHLEGEWWEVGVHIADVSHYVTEGSIIDREAEKRATSVYLVDRTIPMLPERLCNFICSLRPDEEKLAYSTIFVINEKGDIKDWHLAHTVIRSNRRFTYEEVQYTLERNREASPEDLTQPGEHPEPLPEGAPLEGEYVQELVTLNRLAKTLRAKRFKNGSIGFDRAEVRFEIDEKGHPISTYIKVAKDANKLVEEFMLLANRSVAEMIGRVPKGKKAKTLPYRIHDVPDPEKLEKLSAFIAKFGLKIRTEGTKTEVSKSLNRMLSDVKGQKEEAIVEMVALRAMQKARYSVHNIGHYGLMFQYYTHFTSPIRRYPDTMVHRLLTRYAEGGRSANANKYEELCEHASAMEQLATQAERASIKYKQVEFMADRLGQEFDGTVSGVTEFGLYVEITENGCEGMVPLRSLLDDYYEFDERNYCLIGRRFRRRYQLGDKVRIRVDRANLDRKQLDFVMASTPNDKSAQPQNTPAPFPNKSKKKGRDRSGRKRRK